MENYLPGTFYCLVLYIIVRQCVLFVAGMQSPIRRSGDLK